MTSPQKLTGLNPRAYEHPSDAAALNALSQVNALGEIIRKLDSLSIDRLLRVQLTGSYIKVGPASLPDLHELLEIACDRLDMPALPELYVGGGPQINAFTACVEQPLIMLQYGAVERLSREELLFVIAHEVGHIKSSHVLYYQTAELLPILGGIAGAATGGLGALLGAGLHVALLHWKRMAELTADRAGLLASQDTTPAVSALMKIAGLPERYFQAINTEGFLQQAREFQAMDADTLSLWAKWLATMGATHPWTVMRAQQLMEWYGSGCYQDVLKAPHLVPVQRPPGVSKFCTQCGNPLYGTEAFCPICGRPLGQAQAAGA